MDPTQKVLVIDDNPMNREIIGTLLKEKGLAFSEAQNGKEALKLLHTETFWLVFTDLLMPGMDGFEITRRIREMGLEIPIIAISALSMKKDREQAFEAGCNAFLPKPVDLDKISNLVTTYQQEHLRQTHEKGKKLRAAHMESESTDSGLKEGKEDSANKFQILLVEPDEKLRLEFASLLLEEGHTVESMENGAQAWIHLSGSKLKPQIVISNLHMPEIDGLGLLAMIKRAFPAILFILVTPTIDSETIQLAAQEGVDSIINQSNFKDLIFETITAETSKSGHRNGVSATTQALQQVREAQKQLIQYGCEVTCKVCDIAYSSLHEAGGDLASCRRFNLEGKCGMVIMDVAGHDILSSYLSAVFLGILSSNWSRYQQPHKIAELLNRELFKLGYQNSHICLTAVLWDPLRRTVQLTQAGNPGGFWVDLSGDPPYKTQELAGGGMVIGLLPDNQQMVHHEFVLKGEGYFIFHTDGIDPDKLKAIATNPPGASNYRQPDFSSQDILDAYLEHYPQEDDILIVKLNIPPQSGTDQNLLSLKSSFDNVDHACKWAESRLIKGMVPKGVDLNDIMICLREALLNCVEHGNLYDESKTIDLRLIKGKDDLEIRISDEGAGFNLEVKIKEQKSLDGLQIGKRGLALMSFLADSLWSSGSSIVMQFKERVRA